jgi:Nickel responsive protein SCO4226-like
MPSFLIEVYAPRSTALQELIDAARSVARETAAVRYVDSIYAPEDETCFHVFDGPSAAVVSDAARRASLPFQRVVEVVESPAQVGR